MSPRVAAAFYYAGRFFQLLAMWILLVDVFVLAGPMGPPPKPFYVGVGMFTAGWLMVRQSSRKRSETRNPASDSSSSNSNVGRK